jgi:hypothetical protein
VTYSPPAPVNLLLAINYAFIILLSTKLFPLDLCPHLIYSYIALSYCFYLDSSFFVSCGCSNTDINSGANIYMLIVLLSLNNYGLRFNISPRPLENESICP